MLYGTSAHKQQHMCLHGGVPEQYGWSRLCPNGGIIGSKSKVGSEPGLFIIDNNSLIPFFFTEYTLLPAAKLYNNIQQHFLFSPRTLL